MTSLADLLKPEANSLWALALAFGVLELLLCLPCVLFPGPMGRMWRAFPRSAWAGRVLATVALVWSAFWLQSMPLGPLMPLKTFLPILVPIAVVAVSVFADDLLACRALGGLLVLIPSPLLSAAQWHPSPWRFVMIVAAYLLAVTGMYIIAVPFRLRDALEWATQSKGRLRVLAALEASFGLLLIVLSRTAFRLP